MCQLAWEMSSVTCLGCPGLWRAPGLVSLTPSAPARCQSRGWAPTAWRPRWGPALLANPVFANVSKPASLPSRRSHLRWPPPHRLGSSAFTASCPCPVGGGQQSSGEDRHLCLGRAGSAPWTAVPPPPHPAPSPGRWRAVAVLPSFCTWKPMSPRLGLRTCVVTLCVPFIPS